MEKLKSQNGQVGLLVLLVTIVVMTIAVALASRTASEIAISTNEEQSTSAFESAETIIERILGNPTPPPLAGTVGSSNFTYNAEIVETQTLHTDLVEMGESVEVNLKGYNQQYFRVNWDGNACNANASAVVVAIFYDNNTVKRYAYDTCTTRGNGFANPPNSIVDVPSNQGTPLIARVKILYSDSSLDVSGMGSSLPSQGREITSRASSLDDQSRAIRVTEGYPMAPSIFDYAVYSAGTIENIGP